MPSATTGDKRGQPLTAAHHKKKSYTPPYKIEESSRFCFSQKAPARLKPSTIGPNGSVGSDSLTDAYHQRIKRNTPRTYGTRWAAYFVKKEIDGRADSCALRVPILHTRVFSRTQMYRRPHRQQLSIAHSRFVPVVTEAKLTQSLQTERSTKQASRTAGTTTLP